MTDIQPSQAVSLPVPVPDPGATAAPTGTLSITTEPSPLAVAVCDHQLNTVAQATSPAKVSLAPGLYMVRASRVGRPDLTQFAWVVSNSDRSVHLSDQAPPLLKEATTAVSGWIDRNVRKLPTIVPAQPSQPSARLEAKPEPFWVRFMRLKDWDTAEQMEFPPFSSRYDQGNAVLDITNPHLNVVFAQVARPGTRTVNVAIPPAGTLRAGRCHLVVSSHPDVLQAHVRLATDWANSALQYMALGHYEDAKQLVEAAREHQPSRLSNTTQKVTEWLATSPQLSRVGRMAQRVFDRFDDPAAALVPRYVGLRTRDPTVFNTLGDFLLDVVQGLSDGLVISAEIAARQRLYRMAALRILNIQPGGLPLFTEGASLLAHRIKELIELQDDDVPPEQLPEEESIEKLKLLRRVLLKWAPFLRLNSPTVTFRGNDITQPQESESPVEPTAANGWIAGPLPARS